MKRFEVLLTVFFVSVLSFSVFFVGCKKEAETKKEQAPSIEMKRPRVEGIKEFHEVLFPVWHEFLPNGDYESIRKSVPEFQKSKEILMKVELPLFYQHVKDDFEKKREELALSIEKLDSVAQTKDDKKLEKAVENMHSAFEQMARVLAPRMKELEQFHLVLYPLWHEAMPNKDYQAIKSAIHSLESKMDALMKAEIPEDFKDIETPIIEKREALGKAVENLANVCRQNKDEKIIDKLTQMHESFRALDEVFE
jgi:flagellar motility protein MotE (MotC chaperone)